MAFAHAKGVIHRDLKPENIMLDDFGVVLVMDWGLAKVVGLAAAHRNWRAPLCEGFPPEAASATLAGSIMGTPQYMSRSKRVGKSTASTLVAIFMRWARSSITCSPSARP